MKKNARIILTYGCNRSCPGCCNETIKEIKEVTDINYLSSFKEFILTGGEPFTLGENLEKVIDRLKQFNVPIILYTAWFSGDVDLYKRILNKVDKITFTLHYNDDEAKNKKDFENLKALTEILPSKLSARLVIDSRLNSNDLSLYIEDQWDVRVLYWKDYCPIPEKEELLFFNYKNII